MAPLPQGIELSRLILEEITAKWSLLVLDVLCKGPVRFNQLRRELPQVTQKALTQCLRRLEASGFVIRTVVSFSPVVVNYQISPLGRSLEPHLKAILLWAEEHGEAILLAQQAYADEQKQSAPDRE